MTEARSYGSHKTLRRILAHRSPAKILDCPTGTGVLSKFLRDQGWDVHCADIDSGTFQAEGLPFTKVNLNRSLPFEAESFDAVLCANGIHRLYNPAGAVSEFYRILRPGGSLYLNLQNYASMRKRLRFLVHGSITNLINESTFDLMTTDDPEANVRNHLFYPQLADHLESAGFGIVDLQSAKKTTADRILWPFAVLVSMASLLVSPADSKRNRLSATRSRAILHGGEYFYVESVKPRP